MQIIKLNKVLYYFQGYLRPYLPFTAHSKKIKKLRDRLSPEELSISEERIRYYIQNNAKISKEITSHTIKDLKKPKSPKAYYFDTYEYARFFTENLPISYEFGDVIKVPETPSIVKSRPISSDNSNSILLKLDKARHFVWIKNDKKFIDKKDMLIGRAAVYQEHRYRFYEKYFHHPLCDLGQVNSQGGNLAWQKPKMSLEQHLDYKFILSLEGNDVATNLKWIMSSNSIAVMPKPNYETWFMEGKLQGGKHYIEILDDYSNLEEQLNFYILHPEKCEDILHHAHEHCSIFYNKTAEDYCSMRVLECFLL